MAQNLEVECSLAKGGFWFLRANGTSNGDDNQYVLKDKLVSALPVGTESVVINGAGLFISSANAGAPRRIHVNVYPSAEYAYIGGFLLAINSMDGRLYSPLGIRKNMTEGQYMAQVYVQYAEANDIIYISLWGEYDETAPVGPTPVSLEAYKWPLTRRF